IVTGSPGGSRIITAVLQVLLNVIDYRMTIAEAVHAPRIHHQWLPDETMVEAGVSPRLNKALPTPAPAARSRRDIRPRVRFAKTALRKPSRVRFAKTHRSSWPDLFRPST